MKYFLKVQIETAELKDTNTSLGGSGLFTIYCKAIKIYSIYGIIEKKSYFQ